MQICGKIVTRVDAPSVCYWHNGYLGPSGCGLFVRLMVGLFSLLTCVASGDDERVCEVNSQQDDECRDPPEQHPGAVVAHQPFFLFW